MFDFDEFEKALRAVSIFVASTSLGQTDKPEQVIDRAELFYNWITGKDDK